MLGNKVQTIAVPGVRRVAKTAPDGPCPVPGPGLENDRLFLFSGP